MDQFEQPCHGLAINEKLAPDRWNLFQVQLSLGLALLQQSLTMADQAISDAERSKENLLAEAKRFLDLSFSGLLSQRASIAPPAPEQINIALEQLIALYDQQEQPEEAQACRSRQLEFQNSHPKQ